MLFFVMMCKEAEKFTFLLLPTFDQKKFFVCLQFAVFFFLLRHLDTFMVVTLIVLGTAGRYASEFNFLLISVYECHRFSTQTQSHINEHFNILKFMFTLIWFCHSIDIRLVSVEVHRNWLPTLLSQLTFEVPRERL